MRCGRADNDETFFFGDGCPAGTITYFITATTCTVEYENQWNLLSVVNF